MDQDQLQARLGKPVTELTRIEAKDWIKRLRDLAEEVAPSSRTSFGQWPGAHEDREASYLAKQRETNTTLEFRLFNGEQFSGTLVDFTPYTITIKTADDQEMVLRKLAIVYYRQAAPGAASSAPTPTSVEVEAADVPAKPARKASAKKQAKVEAEPEARPDEHHQPLETGLDTDRAGEPGVPEEDNMDEDRGL